MTAEPRKVRFEHDASETNVDAHLQTAGVVPPIFANQCLVWCAKAWSLSTDGVDMDGSTLLDIGLGLALIFAVFSMVASGISDLFAGWLNLRGKMLYDALGHVLGEQARQVVLNHGLVKAQNRDGGAAATERRNAPAYLPSWMFTVATLQRDLITSANPALTPADLVKSATEQLPESGVGGAIKTLADQYGTDMTKLIDGMENWFDEYMARVAGWYKRKSQWILFFVSLFVAVAANINVVGITQAIANDDGLRTQLAASAISSCDDTPNRDLCVKDAVGALPSTELGLFWQTTCALEQCPAESNFFQQRGIDDLFGAVVWGFGVLLGAIAISLGAPFWFDLIGKGRALKSAGKAPSDTAAPPPTAGPQPSANQAMGLAGLNAASVLASVSAQAEPQLPAPALPNRRITGRPKPLS